MIWTEKSGPDKYDGHYEIFTYWNGTIISKRWYCPDKIKDIQRYFTEIQFNRNVI